MSAPKHIFALGLLVLVILGFGRQADSFIFSIKKNLSPYQTPITIGQTKLLVKIAKTKAEQKRGLSGQANLPAQAGLLFVFANPGQPKFWMKEMKFPLDLIWLDANRKIVAISPNLNPDTYPQTFSSQQAVQYVLEVNAGLAQQQHLKIGDQLKFKN
ncbi:MAG: hypothetical protein COX02_02530 [Candidatus Vogelbacteria bacterium CG22_combo_CG10-13_8_21_14_all_37_9]|uniref:DUF192 domain-containing protein n=1 Tax=Candidatus Vogelbacteria bacterium CG22_combo_CG10-13_8_21_14_all_37_9 TaxID=1975046 RepID=A0A2H0BK87_9BACT|nr:MAG: hypothetical protein BK005_01650 [bacterium CG10_37_50]PIP58004.1 MAG: hypothetical protein COX02_02530 [Candidatus Vogelbacteria bacterium CG22_combo_CG10-13_8_21_14_all_37_9]